MKWKSTLGVPLHDPDEARIDEAWNTLCTIMARADVRVLENCEPVEMLDAVTEIIMACWEVRRAISEAWYQANKALGAKPRAKPLGDKTINDLIEAINRGELK